MNTFYGNGAATSKSSPSSLNSNNFGLGLIGASQNNLVERNKIGGNINGLYLGGGGGVSGNVIRRNIIAGNPAVQVMTTFGASIGADIQDLSTAAGGTNSFEENYCLTYARGGVSVAGPCPNITTPEHKQEAEHDQKY